MKNHVTLFLYYWRPQGDSNPCRRRERPVSWTWLDDGDAGNFKLILSIFFRLIKLKFALLSLIFYFLMLYQLICIKKIKKVGRAGIEPTTNGLKVRCSTS